ncbi:MAG TPA: hypothetical protein VKS20_01175 [Candidatus Acidoferrales bacterium]|nr:hypothetical protein [Candidatus Acidoferrales bacterium]
MSFSVTRNDQPDFPFAILNDGAEFLTGFQSEEEAQSVAALLNALPEPNPKVISIKPAQVLRQSVRRKANRLA